MQIGLFRLLSRLLCPTSALINFISMAGTLLVCLELFAYLLGERFVRLTEVNVYLGMLIQASITHTL